MWDSHHAIQAVLVQELLECPVSTAWNRTVPSTRKSPASQGSWENLMCSTSVKQFSLGNLLPPRSQPCPCFCWRLLHIILSLFYDVILSSDVAFQTLQDSQFRAESSPSSIRSKLTHFYLILTHFPACSCRCISSLVWPMQTSSESVPKNQEWSWQ